MGAASLKKPQLYLDDEANLNSRLSTQLPYIFACTRFAHVMKKAVRSSNRAWRRDECETFLNDWISRYVLLDDVASQEARAKFPLREGRIQVVEDPGRTGGYSAIAFLRPHFQLDEMAVTLRLVVPLPVPQTEPASPVPCEV
jgi:type VI secretion system protein ImpC